MAHLERFDLASAPKEASDLCGWERRLTESFG
ncbi:hypothetical protein JMJ77_0015123 [Colletotrichum scovillei]|uniref:Uncharacterized protein n=1 Tax=Colletotrichum scovillei TaxID=1209932 RepID=A0A9P7R2Z6_9PEZI|nr:hypothetical protein JMJ77_0015123 [Colletotrichum scovillei]KAG7056746.1 hypothetical protein JMJ78_0000536 [Colletotrichum scovillei]KAG7066671.1 hypothetical protein JMJ76_0000525 [Colletotrichum scovillei]